MTQVVPVQRFLLFFMETVSAEGGRIFSLASECDSLFLKSYTDSQCSGAAADTPHSQKAADAAPEKAELQHERFRLWASFLGVFAEYSASLDKGYSTTMKFRVSCCSFSTWCTRISRLVCRNYTRNRPLSESILTIVSCLRGPR